MHINQFIDNVCYVSQRAGILCFQNAAILLQTRFFFVYTIVQLSLAFPLWTVAELSLMSTAFV